MRTPTKRQQGLTVVVAAAVLTSTTFSAAAAQAATRAPDPSSHQHPHSSYRHVLQRDLRGILKQGAPGVLARVDTPRGSVTVRGGYGDLRRRTPVPRHAHFRIASFTKTFVSATVLRLVGQGRLSLDDSVEKWLPGVIRGNGNDGRELTVRNLLQQTSGLPDYVAGLTWMLKPNTFFEHRFDTVTQQQAVRLAMSQKPVFAPGTSWGYSNTNYLMAGLVIQSVTGRPWQDVVRDQVVRPLHLHQTSFPRTSPAIPAPHARGYERWPGPGATPEDPKYGRRYDATHLNPSWGGSAGEMISTAKDGNTFLRALVGGRLLKPAQLAQMEHTVATDADFRRNWPGARYGLGLIWIPNDCGGSWAHGGDIQGFRTRNGVSPDGRRSVMVSLNTDSTKPRPGVPMVQHDVALDLINDALCAKR